MSARKKKTRKTTSARRRARNTIDAGLRDLEKRLPSNLRGPVRDLRANIASLQKQVDKARKDREDRWKRLEAQIRRDTAKLLRRLEKAVTGAGAGKKAKKKASKKKKSTRKKTAKRKAAPRKASRKKASTKKASRKKTARR